MAYGGWETWHLSSLVYKPFLQTIYKVYVCVCIGYIPPRIWLHSSHRSTDFFLKSSEKHKQYKSQYKYILCSELEKFFIIFYTTSTAGVSRETQLHGAAGCCFLYSPCISCGTNHTQANQGLTLFPNMSITWRQISIFKKQAPQQNYLSIWLPM